LNKFSTDTGRASVFIALLLHESGGVISGGVWDSENGIRIDYTVHLKR
jgi:hypothetical protein